MVAMSENLLCPAVESTQPATAAAPSSAVAEMFKPQGNLKPNFLDKQAKNLEVRNFCQSVEVYIVTGFKNTTSQKVWPYIKPLMHKTWSNALELNNVKEKCLKETLEMLLEESQLRNQIFGPYWKKS